MLNPAESLLNLELDGGWIVSEKFAKVEGDTGGNCSICYKVRRGAEVAFLKALDISGALSKRDGLKKLQFLTTAHNYEVELLAICAGHRMDKIVSVLENGQIIPKENNPGELPVHYLIFEIADQTIRSHVLTQSFDFDNASLMRSIHNVSVAINQLHSAGIAHQDIKPSNVLLFNKNGSSKLADLGRAESIEKQSVFFDYSVAGDPLYAPPELLYRHISPDWDVRRKATDLYHLGSLICFYYSSDHVTALLRTFMPANLWYTQWSPPYKNVLPYLNYAFGETLCHLEEMLAEKFSDITIAKEIVQVVAFLCDPDPVQRGHPENKMFNSTKYAMERFMNLFDKFARKFESKSI